MPASAHVGQTIPGNYRERVTREIMERLAMVGARGHGLIEVDVAAQSYRACRISTKLLSLKQECGCIDDLTSALDKSGVSNLATSEDTAVFLNAESTPLRLRSLSTPAGGTQLFFLEDLSAPFERETSNIERGRDIAGLFNNAPYGIYRSTFDGKPLRANPAMLKFNGEENEDALRSGVKNTAEWYVDPNRRADFITELRRYGRVTDFVSEINVGKSGKRLWVSESAWVVNDAQGLPLLIEGTVADASDRVRQESEMRVAALTDQLTGLGNRAALIAQLSELPKSSKHVAIMLVDVDRFKDINDIFGHDRGDQVLLKLARRLKSASPEGAFIARLGGDEFAVIAECSNPETSTFALAEKIICEFERPVTINDTNHLVGASIGISIFPGHATNASELMRAADMALYHAKNSGKGRAELFHEELAVQKRQRLLLANDLRQAEKRGELELHYQSIVDAQTAMVVGLEALMRWRHPVRGLVSPAEFIPVAEEQGMMSAFGAWAINEACRHLKSIPDEMHIAVNVSATQFYSANLVSQVRQALLLHGVAANRLELEVTENVVLRNEAATIKTLEELKALGVRITVDDFGTGYSSLSYLQRFAFDKIKIDRSFVQSIMSNPVNAAIVRAVLSIGRDLELDVVAEGVETEFERNALLEQGCPYFQGFLYSKPRPLDSVVTDLNIERLRSVSGTSQLNENRNLSQLDKQG